MRLAVVTPFLDRQHGTELCIIEQIERLAQNYHWNIELYSQKVSQLYGVRPAPEVSASEPGAIRWHQVSDIPGPHVVKYLWWFFANYWHRWRDRRSGACPDLVYSPGINCPDADVIVVHIVFHEFHKRVKGELAFHRVPLSQWLRVVHRRLYYRLAMCLERRIYSDLDTRLIAVSSLVAAQLKSNFRREDVVVIPNAVDVLRFTKESRIAERNTSRQHFSYNEGDFVLLLIGNDWKKKGLDALLRALALLKDLTLSLLVVGSDEPGLYHALVDQLGLRNRVHFERPSKDVLSFYAAADLYVGPSLEDSFGLPIVEAMACGLPVIASANAGASEMIRDGSTGFILHNPQDQLELASVIRRIHNEDTIRFSIGEAASRYVAENSTWDQNAESTKRLLEDTLRRLELG